jgi:hypothetical protein
LDHGLKARSVTIASLGAAILLLSAYLLVSLPRYSPLEVPRCTPVAPPLSEVGTSCPSSINLVYPAIYVVSVAGTALIFLGVFGRRFILNPVFVAGMIALEYGLAGVVARSIAGHGTLGDVAIFAPLLMIGGLAISVQAYRFRYHGRHV